MRIVAGRLKGRQLAAPDGMNTRPTSDRARQALFNILGAGPLPLADAVVLDGFAGSGALGFEALSRGARHATFFETDPAAAACLAGNVSKLKVEAAVSILKIDVTRPPPAREPCHFIFLDPPYGKGLATQALPALREKGWLATDCLIVVEVAAREPFTSPLPDFAIEQERSYGAARLVFLRP